MEISEFQPRDIEHQQEPVDAPTLEDVMFAIFEYARRSDGVDSAEGPARVRQRERMFSKDRELRAMLDAMQTHAYAEGRKDEREEATARERDIREACVELRDMIGNPVISGTMDQTLHGQTVRLAIKALRAILPGSCYMDQREAIDADSINPSERDQQA